MAPTDTIVRTYAAPDRASAERSYLAERQQAAGRGWEPRSTQWRSDGRDQVLTVVYEGDAGPAEPDHQAPERGASPSGSIGTAGLTAASTIETAVAWNAEQSRQRDAERGIVETLDLHSAGAPLRLIRSGYPDVPRRSMDERRTWVRKHADHVRLRLMLEPRGHRDMVGAVLLPPSRDEADVAVLFMDSDGYGPMCGHGIIALTQGLIEEGLYPATSPTTRIRWETPAGLVDAIAEVRIGRRSEPLVRAVRYVGVPAYLHADRLVIRPRGIRLFGAAAERKGLGVQLAYGGAYYGIVDVAELGMRVVPEQLESLTRAGSAITRTLRRDHAPEHPTDASLSAVRGTILVDSDPGSAPDGLAGDATIRNVTIYGHAQIDRSPNGSGTSAILAARCALGASDVGDVIIDAGITGETFVGRVEGRTTLGGHEAVVTSVQGRGYVTGHHVFVVDERDPLAGGFQLR